MAKHLAGCAPLFARIVSWDRRQLAVESLALPATDGARQLSSSVLELVICMWPTLRTRPPSRLAQFMPQAGDKLWLARVFLV